MIDKSKLQGTNNPVGSTDTTRYNKLLQVAVEKGTLTDRGTENVNGTSLRHISVSFGADAVKDLLDASGISSGTSSQFLNNVKVQQASFDVWIDESTSYVHKLEYKLNLSIKASSTPTATGQTETGSMTSNLDTTVNLSNFNSPITISAPANAIPTDNLSQAFQ